ncbi:MAG: hypothetical protein IJ080_07930, partial [Oscillospiraceae bacterium]|nr:hypothetical protein [Oscillospiraceae bacterium]
IRPNEARRWAVPTPFSLIYSAVPFMTGAEYLISEFAPGRTRWAVPTPLSLIYSAVPFMTGSEYLISEFDSGRTRQAVSAGISLIKFPSLI